MAQAIKAIENPVLPDSALAARICPTSPIALFSQGGANRLSFKVDCGADNVFVFLLAAEAGPFGLSIPSAN
jgi:hypothetical protein